MEFLFVSRVRIKLLQYFFSNPEVPIHLRAAVREIKEEINAVRRELVRMEEFKLLTIDVRGNRKYYALNPGGPFLDELRGIVLKTFGLGGDIIRNLNKLGEVHFAILTGSYTSSTNAHMTHPLDLVLIGNVDLPELTSIVAEHEKRSEKEVNYTVFSLADFNLRKRRKDAFVGELLLAPKVMLVGTQEQLLT